MGANLILAVIAEFNVTPGRIAELRSMAVALPDDQFDESDAPRERVLAAIDELAELTEYRDVGRVVGMDGRALLACGGLSWGDQPSDNYPLVCALMCCEPIAHQIDAYAREDDPDGGWMFRWFWKLVARLNVRMRERYWANRVAASPIVVLGQGSGKVDLYA